MRVSEEKKDPGSESQEKESTDVKGVEVKVPPYSVIEYLFSLLVQQ